MRALCNPAPFLRTRDQKHDAYVSHPQPTSDTHSTGTNSNIIDDTPIDADSLEIHISKLYGLDTSLDALEECIQVTAPPYDPDPDPDPNNAADIDGDSSTDKVTKFHSLATLPRWEPLEVRLWLGSLAVYNSTFAGVDCIVATEV